MKDRTVIHRNETETFRRTKDECRPKPGLLRWDDGTDTTVTSVSSSTTTKQSNISSGKREKLSSDQKATLDDFVDSFDRTEVKFFATRLERFYLTVRHCVENGANYSQDQLKDRLDQAAARFNLSVEGIQRAAAQSGSSGDEESEYTELQESANATSHLRAAHSASAPTAPILEQSHTTATEQSDGDADKSNKEGDRKPAAEKD